MTTAQAKQLGLDLGKLPRATTGKRKTRRVERGPYLTRCVACDERFTTRAAEDRHVTAGHNRFELVIESGVDAGIDPAG